jgi:cell division protein ZapA
MSEFTISVKIADRPYRLTIKREDEERIRRAANDLNEKIKQYSENFAFNDKQDLLAMVALEERSNSMISNDKLESTEKSVLNDLEKIDRYLQDNLI